MVREQRRFLLLPGEDVEVVEPEVDHHFLQLPLRLDGAEELRLRQFGDVVACRSSGHPRIRRSGHSLVFRRCGSVLEELVVLAQFALCDQLAHQLVAALVKHSELQQPPLQRRVVDALGMELLLEERSSAESSMLWGWSCSSRNAAAPMRCTRARSCGRGPNVARERRCSTVSARERPPSRASVSGTEAASGGPASLRTPREQASARAMQSRLRIRIRDTTLPAR